MSGDGPTWTDIVGGVGGIVGIGIGGVSAVIAGLAKRDSRRSADASERSAVAAEKSANEAAELNRIEQERRKDEREREHRELAPEIHGEIVAELRDGRATPSLWGAITVPGNDYRVRATAVFEGGSSTELGIDHVIHSGQRVEIHIEQWPPGSERPKTKEIRFQFWPPIEGDGVDVWTCPCDRPVDESTGAPGHWERTCRVVFEPPPQPVSRSMPPSEPHRGGLFGR